MVPDFYQRLGVDPTADRAAIEAALARCQSAWSAGTRNPKNRHAFQSYLDEIPTLRKALLGDATSRAAYDAERAAGLRADRDRRLDELQRLVRLRSAKGGLTLTDRNRLRAEAEQRGLAAADLDRLIEAIPPRPEAPIPDDPDEPVGDVVDPATRGQIRRALDHLGKRDLYDVLGLDRDTPADEITTRAEAERRRWMRHSHVTAEKTAWLEVVSYAQSHLGTPAARSRYDRTLDLEADDSFLYLARFALEGETRLADSTRAELRREAASLGLTPDRTDRLIRRLARTLRLAIDGGVSGPVIDLAASPSRWLRCRGCGGVTELADPHSTREIGCRFCGASLRWKCPLCQRNRWVDDARCACGFPQSLREPLLRHFEAAQQAFKAFDYEESVAHLKRAQEIAPTFAGARKGLGIVKQRLAEIDRVRHEFQAELAARRVFATIDLIKAWGGLVDPTDPDWKAAKAVVSKALRDARGLTARGAALVVSDPAGAREHFRRALEIAADLPEALDGLGRCPPDPPTGLRAEVIGGIVRLGWNAPKPDGLGPVTFRVVRKRRGVPAGPRDGQAIGQIEAAELEDGSVEPGEPVGYAVYSRRGDAESLKAATLGPLLVLSDVEDVRVEVGRREVSLAWVLPRTAAGLLAVRKAGSPPNGPEDGVRLSAERGGLRDTGVDDETLYYYRIYTAYRTPQGTAHLSPGVVVSALPHTPIAPLVGLSATPLPDGRVGLNWAEPDRGQVRILRSTKPSTWAAGERISKESIDTTDARWITVNAPGQAIDPDPPSVAAYYIPFVIWGGMATAGQGAIFSTLPDPTELRALRVGPGRAQLRWKWSHLATQTLAVYKAGAPPAGPDDPEARRLAVTESEYARLGYLPLTLPPNEPGPWNVTVYSLAGTDGRSVVSPGLEPTARTLVPGPTREVVVAYTLRRPPPWARSWAVQFRTDPPGAEIPPTAVVANLRAVPLSADDGQVVVRFPLARDGSILKFRPGLRVDARRLRVFADPGSEPDGRSPVRFRHPEVGPTRLEI